MFDALMQLGLFTAKIFIVFLFILLLLVTFFGLIAKSRGKLKGKLSVKNLNQKYAETMETVLQETLPKKLFKRFLKQRKIEEKIKQKKAEKPKKVYVLDFQGDIKATAVAALREEVTAILNVAEPGDEVLLRLESMGGIVHGYGLAAAQLMRLRAKQIPLTIAIDKVAASGGYMMACVANKILAAPFAIIGSIGVIVQLPNFHRALKEKHIDFEQITAGEYKRTISVFGENTESGREKLQHEIEDIHQLFKNLIMDYRQQIDIQKVATGEHWLGQQALGLKLVDEIQTSDDYLLERSKEANLYEISYETRKSLFSKLTATSRMALGKWLGL
ncbi:protease SohB [Aquicella lusitana]|uniref:Inner membrane peptidase n=1 Tax=Aquicella lusitana TaxID=254246 RepID=A0A370GNA3_9COXI|nr:protease SohB [Aquicella lusitana]RDI45147.1 inner membrane peptidase [Aquicella lusitana]VVC72783.1 putative protease SohB [Aquicella lusitana]